MLSVLVVDDLPSRSQILLRELSTKLGADSLLAITASNSVDAVRVLKGKKVDVLVLDLCFPLRDGQQASASAGLQLIQHILSGAYGHIPEHIVGISSVDESLKGARDEFLNSARPLFEVRQNDGAWVTGIVRLCEDVLKARRSQNGYKVDLVVLAAQHDAEFEELHLALSGIGIVTRDEDTDEWHCRIEADGAEPVHVIFTACSQMGAVDTASKASFLMSKYSPRFVAMSGIMAGVDKKAKLADVIVATSSWDVESGKLSEGDGTSSTFSPSPTPISLPPWMHSELELLARNNSLLSAVTEGEPDNASIRVQCGPVAMVNRVFELKSAVDSVLLQNRKFIGLDMESYALFRAAQLAPHPQPVPLVIKGISDFAAAGKGDSVRSLSARRSARFLCAAIGQLVRLSKQRSHT